MQGLSTYKSNTNKKVLPRQRFARGSSWRPTHSHDPQSNYERIVNKA